MSAALTMSEISVLVSALEIFRVCGGTDKGAVLADLAKRLSKLRHCDQCGVLFDGLGDECQHCLSDGLEYESAVARGGQS